MPPPDNVDNDDTKPFLLDNGDININRVESNKAATITVSEIPNPKLCTATKIVTPVVTNQEDVSLTTKDQDSSTESETLKAKVKDEEFEPKQSAVDEACNKSINKQKKKERRTKKIRWNKNLTETSDGTPFVPEYKKVESPASIENPDSDIIYTHPFKTGTVIEQNGH